MINTHNADSLLIRPVDGQWPMFAHHGDNKVDLPTKLRGLSEVNLSVGWARRTHYVDCLRDSMTGGHINQSHMKRFSNGVNSFHIESAFLYNMTNSDILLMGVGCRSYRHKGPFGIANRNEPEIIYISEEFDSPQCGHRIRSVRTIWRQAMREAKDRSIRVEKIPQKEINRFIAQLNWQPDNKAMDILEDGMKSNGLSDLYRSIRR